MALLDFILFTAETHRLSQVSKDRDKYMAGVVGNVIDLLLFYTLERALFNRMVKSLSKNPQLVKMAVAFWLLLEEIGYHDLTRIIHSFDDLAIEAIFQETLSCLECIQPKPNVLDESSSSSSSSYIYDTPLFATILDEPINQSFFYYNRDFIYRRFLHVMETVCNKIFGENAAIEVDETSLRPLVVRPPPHDGARFRAADETTTSFDDHSHEEAVHFQIQRRSSTLNPNATVFVPGLSDDKRTMFLTFSRGFPLTRQEIIDFFTTNWGDVVQDVVVEQAGGGRPPLYGRAIFNSYSIIPFILNGQSKAKFSVKGKHLWARVYVPRR